MGKYDRIIGMEHHVSQNHPHMSMTNRGAQFSPFAALTGYDDLVAETARFTDSLSELDDDERERLGRELQDAFMTGSKVRITHFVPDARKSGGSYRVSTGKIARIDEIERKVYLDRKTAVYIDDITDVYAEQAEDR